MDARRGYEVAAARLTGSPEAPHEPSRAPPEPTDALIDVTARPGAEITAGYWPAWPNSKPNSRANGLPNVVRMARRGAISSPLDGGPGSLFGAGRFTVRR
jgi:hypothetical protein